MPPPEASLPATALPLTTFEGFEGIDNFRDVAATPMAAAGGRNVARGRLFRSGHLGGATPSDLAALSALGLRLVVDLRGAGDVERDGPGRCPDGASVVRLSMYDHSSRTGGGDLLTGRDAAAVAALFADDAALRLMLKLAKTMVLDDDHRALLGGLLRRLAEPGSQPVLLHCTAGKDRTGWAVAVVLLTLGVAEEDVVADYLRSQTHTRRLDPWGYRERLGAMGLDPALVEPMLGVREAYIRRSLRAVDEGWAGFGAYRREGLGVDDETVDRLRRVFLE